MYSANSAAKALEATHGQPLSSLGKVPVMIYWIGATSFLVDVSSEMLTSVLPVFLMTVLSLSPLQVGLFDGLFQGITALTLVFAAWRADVSNNPRIVAWTGYVLSALARLLLVLSMVGGALFAFVGLFLDRLGKGIRTAPRDALIAAHARRNQEAAAFGVHRTMDAAGALIGPLLAAALLWQWADRYEVLLSVSLAFAVSGVLVFGWLVRNATPPSSSPAMSQPTLFASTQVALALPEKPVFKTLWQNRSYRRLLCAVTGLGVFTISDGMLYLVLQQQTQLPARYLPLTHVGSALIFMLAAIPIARAATRWAPWRTFLFGYLCLGAAYGLVSAELGASNLARLAGVMVCMGLHHAATDGVLAVMIVTALTPAARTTGLAIAATCAGLAKLIAAPLLGLAWQTISAHWALIGFGVGLGATMIIAALLMRDRTTMYEAET